MATSNRFSRQAAEELALGTFDRALWERVARETLGTPELARDTYIERRAAELRAAARPVSGGMWARLKAAWADAWAAPKVDPAPRQGPAQEAADPQSTDEQVAPLVDIQSAESVDTLGSELVRCLGCGRWLSLPPVLSRTSGECPWCHRPYTLEPPG